MERGEQRLGGLPDLPSRLGRYTGLSRDLILPSFAITRGYYAMDQEYSDNNDCDHDHDHISTMDWTVATIPVPRLPLRTILWDDCGRAATASVPVGSRTTLAQTANLVDSCVGRRRVANLRRQHRRRKTQIVPPQMTSVC